MIFSTFLLFAIQAFNKYSFRFATNECYIATDLIFCQNRSFNHNVS